MRSLHPSTATSGSTRGQFVTVHLFVFSRTNQQGLINPLFLFRRRNTDDGGQRQIFFLFDPWPDRYRDTFLAVIVAFAPQIARSSCVQTWHLLRKQLIHQVTFASPFGRRKVLILHFLKLMGLSKILNRQTPPSQEAFLQP